MNCYKCSKKMRLAMGKFGEFWQCDCGNKIDQARINSIVKQHFEGPPDAEATEVDMSCPLCGKVCRERRVKIGDAKFRPGDTLRVCSGRDEGCPFVQRLPETPEEWQLSVAGLAAHRTINGEGPPQWWTPEQMTLKH